MSSQLFRQIGFLSPAECTGIRRAMDVGAVEAAEILVDGINRQQLVRNAALIEPQAVVVEQIEARLDSCRDDLAAAFGLSLDRREGAGFIRYPERGYYRRHRDRGEDPQWPDAARRAVALVIFLNTSRAVEPAGEFEGGILRLFDRTGEIDVVPEAGTLVAFPADIVHEVTEVRGGTRDTVVDWFYFTERGRPVRDSREAAARPARSAGNAS